MALDDLIHKRRTVADLIRFIGNTAEADDKEVIKTPNYSILLGAGASVTSGVRSGQTLVNDWKKQVYEESNHDENVTLDEFSNQGMHHHGMRSQTHIQHCLRIDSTFNATAECLLNEKCQKQGRLWGMHIL